MVRRYSPPDSPLSSMGSGSDGYEEDAHEEEDGSLRPSKRQKIDAQSNTSSAIVPEPEHEAVPEPDTLEGMSDVSSDTSGDIPSSPINARLEEEDFQDQVTICDWDGCPAGDQGDMDKLVEHIHNSHIENRQKKYTCEWKTCNRKGLPHASGYALKAHMRSHTREKPFYCYLPGIFPPRACFFKRSGCLRSASDLESSISILIYHLAECDRSFTRSDALAKHMRTVHETEALRPSDPVPKSMQSGPSGKSNKLKIIIKTPQSHAGGGDDEPGEALNGDSGMSDFFTPLTGELFSSEELSFPVDKLYRKCYWESKWADQVGDALKKECREWEEIYYKEWLEKEVLLSQVIQSEVDWHDRRKAILEGTADIQIPGAVDSRDGGQTKRVDTTAKKAQAAEA
ncbi:hypothetical protein E4U55_000645 [Claviceps digitariae]|nr:hypothetical protein E4U55_000645 [Claviceps digitariae]